MEAMCYNNKKEKWLGTFKVKGGGSSKRFCNRKIMTDMGWCLAKFSV